MNQPVKASSFTGEEASKINRGLCRFRLRASACAESKSNANQVFGKLKSQSYSAFRYAGKQNVPSVTMHLHVKIRNFFNDVLCKSKVSEECE